MQNSYRKNYPGSNQNYSNQQNPQHPPFRKSNNEASQNQPPNVQYKNEQDVTERINMIRHHPKRNSSQIQPNNALTYQAFRTGCNTLLKYIKGDLFQSTEFSTLCIGRFCDAKRHRRESCREIPIFAKFCLAIFFSTWNNFCLLAWRISALYLQLGNKGKKQWQTKSSWCSQRNRGNERACVEQ